MSRYTGPRVRIMRALGVDLPGLSQKTMQDRPQPPGQHGGQKNSGRKSEFGLQLLENRCLTPHHLQIAPHCVADSHHAVFPVWCGDVISSLQILNRFSKRTQPGLGSAKPNEPGDKRA